MNPLNYCTLEVPGRQEFGSVVNEVLSRVFWQVHILNASQGSCLAVDFPECASGTPLKAPTLGRKIRVFAEEASVLTKLLDNLRSLPLREYITINRIRNFNPQTYEGAFITLSRYRVKSRATVRKCQSDIHARLKRLEEQNNNPRPYLRVHSTSTKQDFSIILQRESYPTAGPHPGVINSYGLSDRNNPFYLPAL